jgi:tetratricopeptide (TPR) repeat protein
VRLPNVFIINPNLHKSNDSEALSKRLTTINFFVVTAFVAFLAGCAGTGSVTVPEKSAGAEHVQPKVDPKAAAAYAVALASMKAGNTDKAEQQFLQLTKDYPTYSGPYNNLGILYFQEDKIEQAKNAFNTALKLNPRSVVSLNHLGIISRRDGKFKEAQDYYERALKVDPDYAYTHLNYGILLELYMGKLPEALAQYKKYQDLTKVEDKKVKGWIVDLQRRIK